LQIRLLLSSKSVLEDLNRVITAQIQEPPSRVILKSKKSNVLVVILGIVQTGKHGVKPLPIIPSPLSSLWKVSINSSVRLI